MLLTWIRQLMSRPGRSRTRRARRLSAAARPRTRLAVECLEERAVPTATATWTGADVPTGNPLWSDGNNWTITNPDVVGQMIPQAGDSLVFPALASQFKTIPSGQPFGPSPPNPNSINDLGSLTLAAITIQDSGYRIADLASGPGSGGVITPAAVLTATYDGSSEWDIPLQIPNNGATPTLQFDVNPNTGPASGVVLTVAGAITETVANSQLDKTGTGILSLGNGSTAVVSTYSGPTLVEAGTLDVTSPDALGSTNVGTTVLNGASIRAFTTVNAEPLTITGLGFGNLGALSGNGTWTGPIQTVGNAFTTEVDLGATGTLAVSGANAVITSSGVTTLAKVDTGILDLQTANTYQADTLVSAGTLRVGADGALAPGFNTTVSAGATLELSGSRTISSENTLFLSGNGVTRDPVAGPIGALATLGGSSTVSVPVVLLAATTIGGDSSLMLSGAVSGSAALTKANTGTLTLAASSTGYTGTATVSKDTLRVNNGVNFGNAAFIVNSGATFTDNGTAGDTTVNGTLGGTGTAGAVTVNSGGVLSPGGTGQIGTLNASGNTTLAGGSTFLEEVNSAASFDKYAVTGSIGLGGSTLQFSPAAFITAGTQFQFVTASGGVSGNFKDTQGNTLANGSHFVANGQDFTINYNATDVTVTAGNLASSVAITSQPASPTFGAPVTFTATVSSVVANPGGTVTFFVDGNQVGAPKPLSGGAASFSVPTDVAYANFLGGPHTITASYSGDPANNLSPSSNSVNVTVARAQGTTTFPPAQNPSSGFVGQSVTFTIDASGTGVDPTAPKPTGSVQFVNQTTGQTLGTGTLSFNVVTQTQQATITTAANTPLFALGANTIRADYTGQPPSTGPGDQNYAPSSAGSGSGTFVFTMNSDSTSTALVTDHPSGAVFGEPVTFTATVNNTSVPAAIPSGTVTFVDTTTGATLGSKSLDPTGNASLTVNNLTVPTHNVVAHFTDATGRFNASDSNTVAQTINPGTVSMTLVTSKSPSTYGEPVTFTATITPNAPSTLPPQGSVTFIADFVFDVSPGVSLGTSPVGANGQASVQTSSLAAGTHSIQANYNPPANTYNSGSAFVTQTVNPASTTTTVSSSVNPSAFGQPVTFTVTVTAQTTATPTGNVTLSIDNSPVVTLTLQGGQAAFTTSGLSGGSHTVTATYTPDTASTTVYPFVTTNFTGSSTGSPAFQQVVNSAATTTTLSASANPAVFTQTVTFTARVSAAPSAVTPTGSVTFSVDGSPVTTVPLDATAAASFSTASLAIGSHAVTAAYNSNSTNFTNSGDSLTVTVRAQPTKVYVNPAFTGPAGSDPDGAGPATAIGFDAFPAIQPALNVVATGGTVVVAAGTYPEALTLTRSVIIQGAGSGVTALAGQPGAVGLNLTTASGVVLSGLTARGFAAGLIAGPPTTFLSLTDVHFGGNRFNSFAGGVATLLVTGGPGDDTFFVTPGSVALAGDNALGYSGVQFLTVDGGGGNNRLVAFLNDITTSDKVWVSAFAISRDTAAFRVFYRATGGTFAGGVVAVLGTGPETVIVQSQLAGAPTTIYAQGGNDIFSVAVTSASAYTNLTLDGGDGVDTLLVFDQSGGGSGQHRALPDGTAEFDMTYSASAISRIHDQNIEQVFANVPF